MTFRSALWAGGMLAVLHTNPSMAELYGSMEELVRDYPPESLECSGITPAPQPTRTVHQERNKGVCWTSVEHLEGLRLNAGTFVADLRDLDGFRQSHIDGAVPLNGSEIEARQFLKGRTVVLVGTGLAAEGIGAACMRLRKAGFADVYALRGGMQAWWASGKPVTGGRPSASAITAISASELIAESASDLSAMGLMSGAESIRSYFPKASALASSTPEAALRALRRTESGRQLKRIQSLILISGKPLSEQEKAHLLRISSPYSLFVYDGDLEEIHRLMANQRAAWKARERAARPQRCLE